MAGSLPLQVMRLTNDFENRLKNETVLKITTQTHVTRTTFGLEGKLAGPWVELLKECWRKTASGNGAVRVLLCDVTFAHNRSDLIPAFQLELPRCKFSSAAETDFDSFDTTVSSLPPRVEFHRIA